MVPPNTTYEDSAQSILHTIQSSSIISRLSEYGDKRMGTAHKCILECECEMEEWHRQQEYVFQP